MNQNFLLTVPFSPLINLFTTICFLLARKAIGVDPQFLACNPRRCSRDGQNITFPFFIQGQQQPFCGYPGFNLSCRNGRPILKLQDNDFVIHHISYETQILRVSNLAVFDTSTTCIPPFNSTSLPTDRFKLSSNQTTLFLLYGCNSALLQLENRNSEFKKYRVDCLIRSETGPTLSMFEKDPLLGNASEACEDEVKVPVDVHRGNSSDGVEMMLERGFVLNWIASNCSICEDSGGKCGFDESAFHFKCFCTDRPHAWHCNSGRRVGLKLAIALSISGFGFLVGILYWCSRMFSSNNSILCLKRHTQDNRSIEVFLENNEMMMLKRYKYAEVKKMRGSFNDKLGQGGYGSVFKGKLSDGRLVAVKILKDSKSNGEEFINEVASISRTSHVNIVTLLGFCLDGSKRALIYEFMSNGSLEKYIYQEEKNPLKHDRQLGWETLYQIAVGIARGLEYLHRGCSTRILHFDIKPHNILLDENFCPKISDFGLSKICPRKESIVSMIGARGTAGYIAPEVFCKSFGGVSHKSDVYSYGMLVLEMVGGRRNLCTTFDRTSEIYFPHWIFKRLELGDELGLTGICNQEDNQIARKMVLVSLWCIQTDPSNRPPITRAIEMLQGSIESLPIPPKPYLSSPSRSPQRSQASSSTDRIEVL